MNKVSEIFIGAGAALPSANAVLNVQTAQTGIYGTDMQEIEASTGTIGIDPYIYIVNKLANGDFKRSLPIKGTSVTGYSAQQYMPASRNVWTIGYARAHAITFDENGFPLTYTAGAGSIEVNNSTLYTASILFKNDKQFYSERPERLSIEFTSAAAATQLSIATQIADAINNSGYGSQPTGIKVVEALVIGDGSGVAGLTAATNYGVEIQGLVINQIDETTYTEEIVYFSVNVNDATGFGATTCVEVQPFVKGVGTYQQIYNMENFFYGYEGALNRRLWPIPNLPKLTVAAGYTSGAFTATSATTALVDLVTISGGAGVAASQLRPGSVVSLDGVSCVIKYFVSANSFIVTSAASLTTNGTGAVTSTAWYTVITINVTDTTIQAGAGVGQFSQKSIYIATPSIIAGATGNTVMTTPSTEGAAIKAALDAWMATTPLAPAAITI